MLKNLNLNGMNEWPRFDQQEISLVRVAKLPEASTLKSVELITDPCRWIGKYPTPHHKR